MRNFKEKEMTDLSAIVGGETEGFTLSRFERKLSDGSIYVEYDVTWVSKNH